MQSSFGASDTIDSSLKIGSNGAVDTADTLSCGPTATSELCKDPFVTISDVAEGTTRCAILGGSVPELGNLSSTEMRPSLD